MDNKKLNRRNAILGTTTLVVAGVMVGFAFAMAPVYNLICEKLGWEGTTQRADAAPGEVLDVPMTVRFDANTDKALPWTFKPVERSTTLKLGETKTIFYRATNTSDHPVTGTAVFNVTPEKAGQYFNKIQCFCFEDQTLQPGQSVDMGVTFFVDPAIVRNSTTEEVRTITLSYTFYNKSKPVPVDQSAALAPVKGAGSVN